MATKTLSASIDLKTAVPVVGIFDLDAVKSQSLNFDDTVVTSGSATAVTAVGGTVLIAAGTAKVQNVYIRNTEAAGGNFVTLETDAAEDWGRLEANNWAFFPVAPSVGLQVRADTANVVLEYAIFQRP